MQTRLNIQSLHSGHSYTVLVLLTRCIHLIRHFGKLLPQMSIVTTKNVLRSDDALITFQRLV